MSTKSSVMSRANAALALGALGVVYGDIGTSPLYALQTVFDPKDGIPLNEANLLGVISMIFWSLVVVVSLKYVTLILRADNAGEGGIMALLALATSFFRGRQKSRIILLYVGIFGAALFYGDGVITPAISVLSAVEGLSVATAVFTPYVVPITIGVLIALFLAQSRGTKAIGVIFGPIMVVWFAVLSVSGFIHIVQSPHILIALNPLNAIEFLFRERWIAFIALGSVVLALTGAEALYADLGHFGRTPIRLSWTLIVFPSLVLNYLGQGSLLLGAPKSVTNPFYHMFPDALLYPMVVLSTVATVIASQAVISGTYSMTKQAMQLGFLPRMRIVYTSEKEVGQIFMPVVNGFLLIAVLAAVIGFGSSARLGGAYGVAVTGTMMITTILTFFVVRNGWHYNLFLATAATVFFFLIDVTFFSANLLKIVDGGWFPLAIGFTVFLIMATWQRGRSVLIDRTRATTIPLTDFLDSLFIDSPERVPGTAVFLSRDAQIVPSALMHNLAHNKVLHERVIFVTINVEERPTVPTHEQTVLTPLGHGCFQLVVRYGFKDNANLPKTLETTDLWEFDAMTTSYFVSRENLVAAQGREMNIWRKRLFITMARNAGNTAEFFCLPPNRVIELGATVEL